MPGHLPLMRTANLRAHRINSSFRNQKNFRVEGGKKIKTKRAAESGRAKTCCPKRDPLEKTRLSQNFEPNVGCQSSKPADSETKYVHANRNSMGILEKGTYKRVDYLETTHQSSGMLLLSVRSALARCTPPCVFTKTTRLKTLKGIAKSSVA